MDDETYLYLKSNKVNISKLVRKLLDNYLDVQERTPEDEARLQQEVEALRQRRRSLSEELAEKSVQLASLQESREKAEKAYWSEKEKAERMNDSLRNAEVMNFD